LGDEPALAAIGQAMGQAAQVTDCCPSSRVRILASQSRLTSFAETADKLDLTAPAAALPCSFPGDLHKKTKPAMFGKALPHAKNRETFPTRRVLALYNVENGLAQPP